MGVPFLGSSQGSGYVVSTLKVTLSELSGRCTLVSSVGRLCQNVLRVTSLQQNWSCCLKLLCLNCGGGFVALSEFRS